MSIVPNDSDRDSDCEEVERPTGGGRWSEGARVPGSAGLFGGVGASVDVNRASMAIAPPLPGVASTFEEDAVAETWTPMQTFSNAAPLKQTTLPFAPTKTPLTKERRPDLKDLVEASKALPPYSYEEDAMAAKWAPTQTAAPLKQAKLPSPSEMLPLTKELAGKAVPARVQNSSTQHALSLEDRARAHYPRSGDEPSRTKFSSQQPPSFGDILEAQYRQMAGPAYNPYPFHTPFSHAPPPPPPPPPPFGSEFARSLGKPTSWAPKSKLSEGKVSAPPPVASSSAYVSTSPGALTPVASSSAVPNVPVNQYESILPSTPQKFTGRTFAPHNSAPYPAYPATPKKATGRIISAHNNVPYPAYTCPSSNGGGYGVESREDKGCGKRLDVVAERAKMHVDDFLEREKRSQERKNALAAAHAARKKHIERLCDEGLDPAGVFRAIEAARYSTILSRSRSSPPAKPLSLAERMSIPTSNIRQRDGAKHAEEATVRRLTKGAAPVQEPQNGGRETVEMEDIRHLERDVEQVPPMEETPVKRKREAEDEAEGEEGVLSRAAKRICRNAPAFLSGAAAAYVSLAYL